jgi:hypothetical protein
MAGIRFVLELGRELRVDVAQPARLARRHQEIRVVHDAPRFES